MRRPRGAISNFAISMTRSRDVSNGARLSRRVSWARSRESAPQFVTRWRVSECLWTGRGCSENTRDFSANPWCLWVSDISYIQTEDLEDPDEGEYFVFHEAVRRRCTRATAVQARLVGVGTARFRAWRPFCRPARCPMPYCEARACVPRRARHAESLRRGVILARRLAVDFEVRIAVRRRCRRGARPGVPRETSRVLRPSWDGEGFTRGDCARTHGRVVCRGERRVSRNHGAVLLVERGRHATQRHATPRAVFISAAREKREWGAARERERQGAKKRGHAFASY